MGSMLSRMAASLSGVPGTAILDKRLWLGSIDQACDRDWLIKHKITGIINLSQDNHYVRDLPGGIRHLELSVPDDDETNLLALFSSTNEWIDAALESGGNVLIHCMAGMSRSATICIAYVMHHHNWTLEQASSYVKLRRPIVRPNSGFMTQLKLYENRPTQK